MLHWDRKTDKDPHMLLCIPNPNKIPLVVSPNPNKIPLVFVIFASTIRDVAGSVQSVIRYKHIIGLSSLHPSLNVVIGVICLSLQTRRSALVCM